MSFPHPTFLKAIRLQNGPRTINKALPRWKRWPHFNLELARRFTTSETCHSDQDLPTTDGQPHTPPENVSAKRVRRIIRTLHPARLTEDDYLDLSSYPRPSFRLRVSLQSESTDRHACSVQLFPHLTDWSSGLFPTTFHGFLYYHIPPSSPPLAGELRFRVTHSRDPVGFAAGSDLLTEQGMPWRYPLYRMVYRQDFRDIVALLLQDRLVSQRTLDVAAAAIVSLRASASHAARDHDADSGRMGMTPSILSALGQEFVYRFGAHAQCSCLFIGSDTILRQITQHFTSFTVPTLATSCRKSPYMFHYPFKGSAIASFERSTLPEHAGKRFAVLRIKRLLDSDPIREVPAPDGRVYPVDALRPREGELAHSIRYGKLGPWAVDVDQRWKTRRALRVLFDNEELYGSPHES